MISKEILQRAVKVQRHELGILGQLVQRELLENLQDFSYGGGQPLSRAGRQFSTVITFDANTCLDHLLNFSVNANRTAKIVKRKRNNIVSDFFSRLMNKPTLKTGYFQHIRTEVDRVLPNAIYKLFQEKGLGPYIASKFVEKGQEKAITFFQRIKLLDDAMTTNDVVSTKSFFDKHFSTIQSKFPKTEFPDENDCKLLSGTSKQPEPKKYLASGDGCFIGIPDLIAKEYGVQIADTGNPLICELFS